MTAARDGRNSRNAPSTRREVSAPHTPGAGNDDGILADLLGLIVSDLPAEMSRRHVLDGLMRIAGVRGTLVYEWDPAAERLKLTGHAPLAGRVAGDDEYQLGEGAIGRAALAAGQAVQGTIALVGPSRGAARVAALGRGAVAAARLATKDGRLLGVLAVVGSDWSGEHVSRSLCGAAVLLAHALESERARVRERRGSELLGAIEILARGVSAEASLAETLDGIARLGLRGSDARACAVYLADRSRPEMRLAVVAPRDAGVPPTWRPTGDAQEAALAEVAVVGAERVGAVVLYGASESETPVHERLARVLGTAVRQRQLLDASVGRTRADDLLWEILGVGGYAEPTATLARAQRLGCDLGQTRVVVVAAAPSGDQAIRLRSAILTADPYAIVDAGGDHVVAIVSVGGLERLGQSGSWSIGASRPVAELTRYGAAYREAQDALDLGARLFGTGRLVRSEDLGSYRFVPALVEAGLRSGPEYEQVSRLSDELLRTLEAYLDCGGNTAVAAKQLYLHRNTLRQRLERISTTLDLDVSAPERWLALQLAIKTARITRLDGARRQKVP